MNFIYPFARLPGDDKMLCTISLAAERLHEKLRKINLTALDISDYTRKYFGDIQSSLAANLYIYSYVLAWSLAYSKVSLENFVFLDYGGGSGVLSMLAKEAGAGTVIYNDIYDVSCRDAKIIAASTGNEADYYIEGDVEQVLDFLHAHKISCGAVASYDVIEHIYDVASFFRKMPFFSSGSLTVVMASSANTFNPVLRRRFMRVHQEVEFQDRQPEWGHKERDCLRAYFSVRKEMVEKYSLASGRGLTQSEIEELASRTRGMMETDIRRCVEEFVQTENMPPLPCHPTNTCDPYTGNWAEHLLNPFKLVAEVARDDFEMRVICGYYRRHENKAKLLACQLLNILIKTFGKHGIRFSPFYVVYARRN